MNNSKINHPLGQELTKACEAGDLGRAYRALQEQSIECVRDGLLRAGFSVVDENNKPKFFKHVQQQLAKACGRRCNGFQLQESEGVNV